VEIKTRDLTLIVFFASLYGAMVFVFVPISFYTLQFRIAGVLRPAIAKKLILAVGYAIGVVIANLFSPFVGFHELVFMPIMSLLAGVVGYVIAKRFGENYFVAGVVIAIIIPISVSWMLNQLFALPMIATFPSIFISELIINMIGAVIFKTIEPRYSWWE
jgi:uncharacterized membrane protein